MDTYANYFYLNFSSFVGTSGDCYDRYLIRISEMVESLNIINQTLVKLTNYTDQYRTKHLLQYFDNPLSNPYKNMESLINHFKY